MLAVSESSEGVYANVCDWNLCQRFPFVRTKSGTALDENTGQNKYWI